jgi:hypothetical protein
MKARIRLTEGDLRRIVRESVASILNEVNDAKTNNKIFSRRFIKQFPEEIRIGFYENNAIYKTILKKGYYVFPNAKVIVETADGRSVLNNGDTSKIRFFYDFMRVVHPEVKLKSVLVPFRTESSEYSISKDTYCHLKILIDKSSKKITFSPNDVPDSFI